MSNQRMSEFDALKRISTIFWSLLIMPITNIQ